MAEESIILISDEEEDTTANESVLIVEIQDEQHLSTSAAGNEVVDEDLSITFSKKALVMPHARYDCNTNPFSPTEDTSEPVENNTAFCEQCFCYICDKLVSECAVWKKPGSCHCNAHKQSTFWKAERDKAILGYLHTFNFDVMEVDADLRFAERHLQSFEEQLKVEYGSFLKGSQACLADIVPCRCYCHTAHPHNSGCKKCKLHHAFLTVYNYSKVYKCVSEFVDKAQKEKPKTAAVMLLGAAKLFAVHTQPDRHSRDYYTDPKSCVSEAVPMLLMRVTDLLRTMIISCDFTASFSKKLQDFFPSLMLPTKCKWLTNSLNVRAWDEPLLAAVLRGQNIKGEHLHQGQRQVLHEPLVVVEARVRKLKEQNKFRELARYLKTVRSDNKIQLQTMKDYVPFYLCKAGDYFAAINSFFSQPSQTCCSACRLSPAHFIMYMKTLVTGMMPVGSDPILSTQWKVASEGRIPTKSDVIRCALRIMRWNLAVFMDPDCWVNLLEVACSEVMMHDGSMILKSFELPDSSFLMWSRTSAAAILHEGAKSAEKQIQIPKMFLLQYPQQALLLLVTQALIERITCRRMTNCLSIVMAFKGNAWALHWLYNGFSPEPLHAFISVLLQDLYREKKPSANRMVDLSDEQHIADFLSYHIQDPRPVVCGTRRYVFDVLKKEWHEGDYLWQYYLRMVLHQQSHKLAADTHVFLDTINKRRF
ncbi:hypothetical protein GN956_G3089 [Arapaima gigas]